MSASLPRTPWPVLRRYSAQELNHIKLPVGGIGTGTVSFSGRGQLVDFELRDHPDKGFSPPNCFGILRTETADGEILQRCLEIALPHSLAEEAYTMHGTRNEGLPRFGRGEFHAAYPLAQLHLQDEQVPVDVTVEVFNPLVPGDAEASGWPLLAYRVALRNRRSQDVRCSIALSVGNFLGQPEQRTNSYRQQDSLHTVLMTTEGLPDTDPDAGSLCLALLAEDLPAATISRRTRWDPPRWSGGLLGFWDDLAADGDLSDALEAGDAVASLAARVEVPPGGDVAVPFLIGWHLPNRNSWNSGPQEGGACCDAEKPPPRPVGNYYTTRWADSIEMVRAAATELPRLEERTVAFVRAVTDCDLPLAIREAALFNLSTLRSQTVFQTPDGRLFGWEGCGSKRGCCNGSCTHVWNYETATAYLFPALARTMRDVEFGHALQPDGFMAFRKHLPLEMEDWQAAAADGQMGTLIKLYREWQLSGDENFLARHWPAARTALEFCWIPGGWDADQDGVMEGCQHNTMDVEYYGPNPQMTGWYLGALRACEEMARASGDGEFASRCRELFNRGSAWMDQNLFNGAYYEQEVRPIRDPAAIHEGLRTDMGSSELADPDYQLGKGCLIDQLVGQYLASLAGLGLLHDREKIRTTLVTIYRHNFHRKLSGHFNPMRVYAVEGEPGTIMCSYPRGERPARPFPYFAEAMTGFEYTAAVGLIQIGEREKALELIQAVRSRFAGFNRNPFDEFECGHHYARAMASWSAIPAWTGFHYSAVTGELRFAASDGPTTWFWSVGSAWGTFWQAPDASRPGARDVQLTILEGELPLHALAIEGCIPLRQDRRQLLHTGLHEWTLEPSEEPAKR